VAVRKQYLPLALLGVVLGVALPCRAQVQSEEAARVTDPAAAPPAAVHPAAVSTLLWLTPSDPELSNRLRGQLVDTSWQLVERATNPQFKAGDRGAQLRVAFEEARVAQAKAVAWVREDDQRIQVLILDVAHSRLSVRDVPRPIADSAQQSAALETAALIVRATLASIDSGTQVGDAVEEPSPLPASAPSVPSASSEQMSTESSPPTTDARSGLWLRVGGQVHVNSEQFRFGPFAGLGVAVEQIRVGVLGHFLLPSRQRAHYVDATGRRAVELEFWQLGLALGIEYDWMLSTQWAVFLGVQPGLTVLHRATRATATLQASPDSGYLLPTVGFHVGLAGPALADVLRPELMLGALVFTRVPELRVGPTPETELDWQPSRFEPWLGLGFRLP
jgi:hypothetical protein